MDDKRYDGRPLLRLLDAYVLSLIGALSSERDRQVSEVVWKRLGGGLDWQTTVRNAAGLPADFGDRVIALWRDQPAGTDPVSFMISVSDGSFVPLIEASD